MKIRFCMFLDSIVNFRWNNYQLRVNELPAVIKNPLGDVTTSLEPTGQLMLELFVRVRRAPSETTKSPINE